MAGPLTPPPGPVTSSYKTLQEVEPRTVVNATNTPGNGFATHVISQPGSYYLDRNLVGEAAKFGIIIAADSVTLDLNGFEVRGSVGSLAGINLAGDRPVIKNGQIRNWPQQAIVFEGQQGIGGSYVDLTVTNNGFGGGFNAMDLRDESRVNNCVVSGNAGFGIRLATGSLVTGCLLEVNLGGGVVAFDASRISGNNFSNNFGASISVGTTGSGGCFVLGNTIRASGGANSVGIVTSGADHIVKGNTVVGSPTTAGGILALSPSGVEISGNTVSGTLDNYDFDPGANNKYEIAVSQLPESIDWPASVRLAGTLSVPAGQSGITINANDVIVDLGGFAIDGEMASANLIQVNAAFATIRNGSLRRSGADGINGGEGLRIADVQISQSAASGTGRGIITGRGANISNVYVRNVTGPGITASFSAIVSRCTVEFASGGGFIIDGNSSVSDCTAAGISGTTATGNGFSFGPGTVVTGCNARSNAGSGFVTGDESLLRNCGATFNSGSGFVVGNNTRLGDCMASSNALSGVRALNVSGWAVDRCTLTLNALAAVNIEGISSQGAITGSVIRSTTTAIVGRGIVVGSGAQAITISGNQISQAGYGVQLDGSACRVTGNAFSVIGFATIANSAGGAANGSNLVGPVNTPANVAGATNPFANSLQ